MRALFVSTYPPTRCGIASFTQSLVAALARRNPEPVGIAALGGTPDLPEVVGVIDSDRAADHLAETVEGFDPDLVVFQHEYGIYPGEDGSQVLDLVEVVGSRPVVVVFHTVLSSPTESQARILTELADRAEASVVLSQISKERLVEIYGARPDRVWVIPHGATTFGCGQGTPQRMALTWGLIGPGKGLEHAIRAFSLLRDVDARYLIAGQTHPNVLRREGEAYRRRLEELVEELDLVGRVRFRNQYVDEVTLCGLLAASRVVVLPYESTEQISSGVLVEALGAGRPVIATRFPQAVEFLEHGPGILVPHRDPEAIAWALRRVFTDEAYAGKLIAHARAVAPSFSWSQVAARYLELFRELVAVEPV